MYTALSIFFFHSIYFQTSIVFFRKQRFHTTDSHSGNLVHVLFQIKCQLPLKTKPSFRLIRHLSILAFLIPTRLATATRATSTSIAARRCAARATSLASTSKKHITRCARTVGLKSGMTRGAMERSLEKFNILSSV